MPSTLASSLAKFQKEQADATSRNTSYSRPASATPARVSTPKPAAVASLSKRSHEAAFVKEETKPLPDVQQTAGTELFSHVNYARKYLKEKQGYAQSFSDIIGYLSLPFDLEKNIPLIKQALVGDDRVELIRKGTNGNAEDQFKYRPKVPVSSEDELRGHLANRNSATGIPVSDLKDGWPDCIPVIDKLEKKGEVLVIRAKKENTPKLVFADSPNWHISVDEDFRDFWFKTKIPAAEGEIRTELEKAGITPTSVVKEFKKFDNKKKDRKKPIRRGGKITNTHLVGVLKDYSGR